jgi:hypothetical protein
MALLNEATEPREPFAGMDDAGCDRGRQKRPRRRRGSSNVFVNGKPLATAGSQASDCKGR